MPTKLIVSEDEDNSAQWHDMVFHNPPLGFVFESIALARLCISRMANFKLNLLEEDAKSQPHIWKCRTAKCKFHVVIGRQLKGKRREKRGGFVVRESVRHCCFCPLSHVSNDFMSSYWLAQAFICFDAVGEKTPTCSPKISLPYARPQIDGGRGWALYQRYERLRDFLQTPKGTMWKTKQLELYLDIVHFREDLKTDGFVSIRDRWKESLPKRGHPHYQHRDFMCFFLLVLTAGVGDVVVCPNCKRIFDRYPVSAQWVLDVGEEQLASILSNMSKQYKNAHALTLIAKDLLANFAGKVPMSMEQLMSYKQVGPKIAVLTLQNVHGINAGIAIDRHLRRVFAAFGWIDGCTSDEEAMYHVQLIIPQQYWPKINDYLAGLCQMLRIQSWRKAILGLARGRISASLIRKMDQVSNGIVSKWNS